MKRKSKLRKADPSDAKAIKALVNDYAAEGFLLPRSLSDIYENIRNYWVAEEQGRLLGCLSLQVCWEDMAEIRSLAVAKSAQGQGWGRALVEQGLEEAGELGLKRVFTLTFLPEFFGKIGFVGIEKEELPQKIWKDCLACHHFPDCKEVAMVRGVPASAT